MKTTLSADGKIGIPDEIRQTDHLSAGDSCENSSDSIPAEGPRQGAVGGRISTISASGSPAGLESVLRRP